MPLVEQELPTLPEHPSSPQVFSGVRVNRSLVLCVCFVDRCLSFCPFSFGHSVVCPSSIYGFWLPFYIFKHFLLKLIKNTIRVMFIFALWVYWYVLCSCTGGGTLHICRYIQTYCRNMTACIWLDRTFSTSVYVNGWRFLRYDIYQWLICLQAPTFLIVKFVCNQLETSLSGNLFYLRDRPFNLQGGGMVFCFAQIFFFGQHELEYYFFSRI